MSLLRGLRLSFSTLTALPVGAVMTIDRTTAATAMLAAPMVGAVIGGAQALVVLMAAATLGPWIAAAVVIAVELLLTRALHLDGLADVSDATGAATPQRRLEVMRDPRLGTFGTAAIVMSLLVRFAVIGTLATDVVTTAWILVITGLASRLALPLLTMAGTQAAAPGTGATVIGATPRSGAAVAATVIAVLVVLMPLPLLALTVLAAVALVVYALRRWSMRRLGGLTGDVLGAGVEICALASLLVLAVVTSQWG
jgi:adenosylcobinamide-GDP ribazoletransferase